MIYDRAAHMTTQERWIALALGVAASRGDIMTAYVAAELLFDVLASVSCSEIYVSTYNAALFATGSLRGPLS